MSFSGQTTNVEGRHITNFIIGVIKDKQICKVSRLM